MKPHNQPLELVPLPPNSLYGRAFFHYVHLSVLLALWVQRRSATTMVRGSTPADCIEIAFFVVNCQWDHGMAFFTTHTY